MYKVGKWKSGKVFVYLQKQDINNNQIWTHRS